MRNWQERGIVLGGVLIDAAKIVADALPYLSQRHQLEIKSFLEGGAMPSHEALDDLQAAIIKIQMLQPK